MGKIIKRLLIGVFSLIVFYVSLILNKELVLFLTQPLSDAINSGYDVPRMDTSMLGERFRISVKIGFFLGIWSIFIFINRRIAIAFMVGVSVAYVAVKIILFKWLMLLNILKEGTIFNMENYISYLLLFMFLVGAVFSLIAYYYRKKK